MIIVDIIYNLAVLVALSVLSGFIDKKVPRAGIPGQILQGLLFGSSAVLGMYNPFVLAEGIIFDGRSIVISICTLFFGPIAGIISALMAIIYRFIIGGGGVSMGISVITASFAIGYFFNNRKSRIKGTNFSNFNLYQMGIVVHIIMLLLVVLLPPKNIMDVYKTVSLTVIIVYPLVTLLIGRILLDQELSINYLKKLSESEKLFRTTLYSIGDGVITTDDKARVIAMNTVAEQLTGWKEKEASNKKLDHIFKIFDEKTRAAVEDPVRKIIEKGEIVKLAEQSILISRDGKEIPIADSASPIKDDENRIIGVVLVFSNQTDERAQKKLLEENEERLRLSLSAGNQGLYDLNVQTGNAIVNDEYALMLGYDPETFVETNSLWIERLHPDDKPVTGKAFLDYAEGRTNEYKVEFRQKTKDNKWKWFLSTGKIVEFDLHGNPLRMLGTRTDITKLKETQLALEISEEKFAKMFRSSPDTIILTSLKDGLVVDINEAALKITGYERNEIIGNKTTLMNIWVDPADRESYVSLLLKDGRVNNFETKLRMKSGEIKDALISGEIIQLGDEKYILGVIMDITEHKQSERKLAESEKLFATIFYSNPAAISLTSFRTGKLTNVNQAWQKITGYSESEVVGRSPLELKLWENEEQRNKLIEQLCEHQRASIEMQMKRKTGEVLHLLMSAEVIQLNGEDHLLAMAQDITERKKIEDELLRNQVRLQTLVSNAPIVLFGIDNEGVFTFSDGKGLDTLGLKPGEVVGKSAFEMYKDFPTVIDALRRGLSGEINYAIHKIGESTFEVNYAPLKNEKGNIIGLIGVATDISESKKAQEMLSESEENYRLLFESNPHPMFVYEIETLRFLNVNHIAVKKYGYSFDEFMRMTIKDIRPPHEIPRLIENIKNVTSGLDEAGIWIHKKKDGSLINVEIISHTLDYNGKKAELVLALDVTDRLKAEEDIQRKNKDLAKLFSISVNLLESVEKKSVLERIVQSAVDLIEVDSGAIYLVNEEKLTLEATVPSLPEDFPDEFRKTNLSHHPHILKSINERKHVLIEDSANTELSDHEKIIVDQKNLRSLLYIPLLIENKAHGVIILGTVGRIHSFTKHELEISWTLANLASLALENTILFEKLNKNVSDLKKTIEEKSLITEALKISEARFHTMFEEHQAVMMLIDPETGKIVDANLSAENYYGYSISKLREMNIGEINILPRNQVENILNGVKSKSKAYFNFSHKLSSGEIKEVEVFTTPITVNNVTLLFSIIHDITERRIAENELLKSQAQLRALTTKLEKIREEERINLSRELHDNLGQSLTGLKMDVAWLARKISKKSAEQFESLLEKTRSMTGLIDSTINDVRRISSDLRPNLLDHLGLLPALDWLAGDFTKRTETDCKIISKVETFSISPSTETAVFRIIQEAFTNISRHSKATVVKISIDQTDDEYIISLKDNGEGITEDEIKNFNSLGIKGMHERAIQFGGNLSIKGISGKGTQITINIPKEK